MYRTYFQVIRKNINEAADISVTEHNTSPSSINRATRIDKYCATRTDVETFAGTLIRLPFDPSLTLFSNVRIRHKYDMIAIPTAKAKGGEHTGSVNSRVCVDSGSPRFERVSCNGRSTASLFWSTLSLFLRRSTSFAGGGGTALLLANPLGDSSSSRDDTCMECICIGYTVVMVG